MCFQRVLCCLCFLLLFPLLTSDLFSNSYPLQCTDCLSKTTLWVVAALLCECCWLLLPKCCASPCWHQNVPHSLSQHISPIFKGIFITNPVVQRTGSSFQHSVIVSEQTTILHPGPQQWWVLQDLKGQPFLNSMEYILLMVHKPFFFS